MQQQIEIIQIQTLLKESKDNLCTMRVIMNLIKSMDKESSLGLQVTFIEEVIKMMKEMVMGR